MTPFIDVPPAISPGSIHFPLYLDDGDRGSKKQQAFNTKLQSLSDSTQRSIVIVEDNPGDVQLVREALEDQDIAMELIVLGDGEEAIQYLEESDRTAAKCPRLVIIDLNLPRKSGWDVLQRLREMKNCATTPALILTSSSAKKDREAAEKFTDTRYLQKPSDLAEFVKVGKVLKEMLTLSE